MNGGIRTEAAGSARAQGRGAAVDQGLQHRRLADGQHVELRQRREGVEEAVDGFFDAQLAGHRIQGDAHAVA